MSKKSPHKSQPAAWEIARKTARTDVMHSRIHGQVSRRTERRKSKQRGWGEES